MMNILKKNKKVKLWILTFLIFIMLVFVLPFYMPFMPQYSIRSYFNSYNTKNYKLYKKVTARNMACDINTFNEKGKSYVFFTKRTKMDKETLESNIYEVKRYNDSLKKYTDKDILFYNIYGISNDIDEVVGPYITLIRSNNKNKAKWIVQGIGY